MIPLAVPNLQGQEAAYLQECISSTYVSTVGPFVSRFESLIAELSGTSSASVLCSGTTALHLALEGYNIGSGDLVMLPSLTFIASPNSVRHSGADVWLLDVAEQDWTLDPKLVRQAILDKTEPHPQGRRHLSSGKILKAIMPVMIMGSVPDFEALLKVAKEFDLFVIVDAAAAIGTRGAQGLPLGKTGVDAVCYSFNGNKTVTCGGGGAIASEDSDFIARVKHLSSTGRVGSNYDHDTVAYNFRMTNVQAALGVAQLERIDAFLMAKQKIRNAYAKLADQFSMIEPFPEPQFGTNGHWFSGFWYTGADAEIPDHFRSHMQSAGIDLRPFWKPVHLQLPYQDALAGPMPVTEHLWTRVFPLPCSTHLSDEHLDKVLEAASVFWSKVDQPR